MKAVLILCQFSQGLQKQAHSFPFYFLASQELCGCSLLQEEQLCCAELKTLPKTGEETSVGIRQKSDRYEPQWREEAEYKDHHPEGHRPCISVAWARSSVLSSDSFSSQPDLLNPGEKYFSKFSLLKHYIFKKLLLLFQYFSP